MNTLANDLAIHYPHCAGRVGFGYDMDSFKLDISEDGNANVIRQVRVTAFRDVYQLNHYLQISTAGRTDPFAQISVKKLDASNSALDILWRIDPKPGIKRRIIVLDLTQALEVGEYLEYEIIEHLSPGVVALLLAQLEGGETENKFSLVAEWPTKRLRLGVRTPIAFMPTRVDADVWRGPYRYSERIEASTITIQHEVGPSPSTYSDARFFEWWFERAYPIQGFAYALKWVPPQEPVTDVERAIARFSGPPAIPATPDSVSTQQATITWLHLSDLHFKDESAYRIDQREKALHDDLKQMREDKHLEPDFVVFTGDLAFSGQKEQYAWVERFLDRIRATLELDDKSRVFMVPGNHDVDRSQIDLITARGALALLDSEDDVAKFLAPMSNRQAVFAKFGPFMEFVNRYTEDKFLLDSTHYYWTRRIRLGDQVVGLLGLNTAWMSGFKQDAQGEVSDEGALLVGERQVWEAIQEIEKDGGANLKIALLHHPIDVLNDAFDKPQVRNLLAKHCHFVLHGHLHYPNVVSVGSLEGQTVVIPAGACYDRQRRRSGYNFVQLNMQERTGTVILRRYSPERNEWIPDLDATGERRNGEATIAF